jgi:parvulin-like peptidyl-prolyl isomerase
MSQRLAREPLFHFLIIGAGLFLLFGWGSFPPPPRGGQPGLQPEKIVVTPDDMDQLVKTFAKTWQRPPTETEIKDLVENFVRDEIYYREALAAGLDRDDSVIRRRMRQKMEFILEDLTSWAEPTDEELLAYMNRHPDSYLVEPQVAFRHVYINTSKRGTSAPSDALHLLAQLREGAEPDSLGDPISLDSQVPLSPLWEIRKRFGDEFSRTLLDLASGTWEGPIRSGFGLHLVRVAKHEGGRLPELNDVREIVKRDWLFDRQRTLKEDAYAKIRERYTVTVEKRRSGAAAESASASTGVVTR